MTEIGPANRGGDDRSRRVTEADIAQARSDVEHGTRGLVRGMGMLVALGAAAGGGFASAVVGGGATWASTLCAVVGGLAAGIPLILLFRHVTLQKKGLALAVDHAVQARLMNEAAQRRELHTRLARALDMAEDEVAAHDIIRRALAIIAPEQSVELLLADNSHAHLQRAIASIPSEQDAPGCPVDSPHRCVAVRRSQVQRFADSEELDACPLVRGRPAGRCSAVCVPVSIAGRSVGVLHAIGSLDNPVGDDAVQSLQVLAGQVGQRLGMLRIMAETHLQATTDALTGLLNRRSLENCVRSLRTLSRRHVAVMADLDHFKNLNDTHGHETGDRALRLFAQVLRNQLRSDDLACRYGGEEFVIVLPDTETFGAIEIAGRIADGLRAATSQGGAPSFTASFGIAHSDDADDLDELIQRADRALFTAKREGRNCICVDGEDSPVGARTLTAIASPSALRTV